MKLVHPNMAAQIQLSSDHACEWVIESPMIFTEYVRELCKQIKGDEGSFVLSDGDKELKMNKAVEIITDPLSININNKSILSHLYAQLEETAYSEKLYMKTQELCSALQKFLAQLEQENEYIISCDDNIELISLFKAVGVKLEDYSSDIAENIEQYMKIEAGLIKRKVMVLINICSYLTADQMNQLILAGQYNEIGLLFIDSFQKDPASRLDSCSYYIIDQDGCEIFDE